MGIRTQLAGHRASSGRLDRHRRHEFGARQSMGWDPVVPTLGIEGFVGDDRLKVHLYGSLGREEMAPLELLLKELARSRNSKRVVDLSATSEICPEALALIARHVSSDTRLEIRLPHNEGGREEHPNGGARRPGANVQ